MIAVICPGSISSEIFFTPPPPGYALLTEIACKKEVAIKDKDSMNFRILRFPQSLKSCYLVWSKIYLEPKHYAEREILKPVLLRAVLKHIAHVIFGKYAPGAISYPKEPAITHFGKMVVVVYFLFPKFLADLF